VRNSWGLDWALDSPESAGHALMPYEYVERYTFEAFTGPAMAMTKNMSAEIEPAWREYVRVLEKDERDIDGKLLKRGKRVLCHPSQPQTIREDSLENRQEFRQLDHAWNADLRQRIWFPPINSLKNESAKFAEDCRTARKVFLAAIDENIMSARRQPMPEVKALPFWFAGLAWEPKIKRVEEVADLSVQLTDRITHISNTPKRVLWTDEWLEWLASLNGLKIYALSGMTTTVHVIAAIPARLHFQAPGQFTFAQSGQDVIDLVRDIYEQWSRESGQRSAFAFFTLASASQWPDQVKGHAAGDHWVVVSSCTADGRWRTSAPRRFADRLSLRDFMDRLRPETRQQRISRVKGRVDEFIGSGYAGNIHVDKLAKEIGYRRTAVRDALFALQGSGHYRVYRTPEGQIAIGPKESTIGTALLAPTIHRNWLARVACLGPAVSVGIWFVKDVILGRPFEVLGFAAMIPLAYGGEWLNTRFRKWRENKE
ncbi:MAG: hypothetical protein KDA55_12240, partial [Planctomycetales bacterium]|nr:hypothetical protein [Planctomycetales bacterium]